jgi:hypothetical protein
MAAANQDRWWEQVGFAFGDDPVFAAMVAYGRYWRITGQDPPPEWKPGDPIPEPNYDDEDDTDGDRAVIVCEEPR